MVARSESFFSFSTVTFDASQQMLSPVFIYLFKYFLKICNNEIKMKIKLDFGPIEGCSVRGPTH